MKKDNENQFSYVQKKKQFIKQKTTFKKRSFSIKNIGKILWRQKEKRFASNAYKGGRRKKPII